MNKLNFGEAYSDVDDMGFQAGSIREVETRFGTFKIQKSSRGYIAWLEMGMPGGEFTWAVWEDKFTTEKKAREACQDYYEGEALGALQEAFGAEDDNALILTGKQARHLYKTISDSEGNHRWEIALELAEIMGKQGVSR